MVFTLFANSAFAYTVDTFFGSPLILGIEDLTVEAGGNLSTDPGANSQMPSVFVDGNSTITLNSGAVAISAQGLGIEAGAIEARGVLESLDINDGVVTSNAASGTVKYTNLGNVDSVINVSSSGVISNITSGGIAVSKINNNNLDLTINNSGVLIAVSHADSKVISIVDSDGGSSLALNNNGTIGASIVGTPLGKAIYLSGSGNSATIANSSTGTIRGAVEINDANASITNQSSSLIYGNVSAITGDLDITNSGTVTGNIVLGINASSSLTINGGSITGNVTLNNASQLLTFNGNLNDSLIGNVNGAGKILVSANTVLNGNIGNSTALSQVEVAASKTLYASDNNNSISATNIKLNSGSGLRINAESLSGTVDGGAPNQGIVTLDVDGVKTNSATIGSSNGIEKLTITGDDYYVLTMSN